MSAIGCRWAARQSNVSSGLSTVTLHRSIPLSRIFSVSTRLSSLRIFKYVIIVKISVILIVLDRLGNIFDGVGVVRCPPTSAFAWTQLRLESDQRARTIWAVRDTTAPSVCNPRTVASVCSCSRVPDAVVAWRGNTARAFRSALAVCPRAERPLENRQTEHSVCIADWSIANGYSVSAAALSLVWLSSFRAQSTEGTRQVDSLVARRSRFRFFKLHYLASQSMLSVLSIVTRQCARRTRGASRRAPVVEQRTACTAEDHYRLERGDRCLALTNSRLCSLKNDIRRSFGKSSSSTSRVSLVIPTARAEVMPSSCWRASNETTTVGNVTQRVWQSNAGVVVARLKGTGKLVDESFVPDKKISPITFAALHEQNVSSLKLYELSVHLNLFEESEAFRENRTGFAPPNASMSACWMKQRFGRHWCRNRFRISRIARRWHESMRRFRMDDRQFAKYCK